MTRLVDFPNEKEEFKAFSELSFAGQTIKNVKGMRYVITAKQCELLTSRNIKYEVIEHQ